MKELEARNKAAPIQIPAPSPAATPTTELFQKRWFCVGLYSSGTTIKQDAESPQVFKDIITHSMITWVDCITSDPMTDLPAAAAQLGFSEACIASFSGDPQLPYQDFDNEMWMRFPSIQIRGMDVKVYPLLVLVRKNFVFTIHASFVDKRFIRLRRYSDIILKKIPLEAAVEDKLTILLTRIIDANNDSNFRHLKVIDERGDDLNEDLMSSETDRSKLGPKIYEMKHALITYLNALWDTVDVLHALRYGDAEIITNDEKLLEMISVMSDEVKGQIGLAEHMSEVLASGLEVMQSIYNNQLQTLNNRLSMVITYLTIIGTAVLVPNTLATMLGNSVFTIGPSDLWWYILLFVGATVAATLGMWWWLKRRGWMPKKPEC
jgi:magnesium transporter